MLGERTIIYLQGNGSDASNDNNFKKGSLTFILARIFVSPHILMLTGATRMRGHTYIVVVYNKQRSICDGRGCTHGGKTSLITS